jgi:hypothetical protein
MIQRQEKQPWIVSEVNLRVILQHWQMFYCKVLSMKNQSKLLTKTFSYADALAELAETRRLDTIQLHFVGPECPKQNVRESRKLQSPEGRTVGELLVRSYRTDYNNQLLKELDAKPDIVVFHNPGFTCPDYDWSHALAAIPKRTPFLLTTNTELEGIADCQYLLDNDLIQKIPPTLAEIFADDFPTSMDQNKDDHGPFFNENPFCGNRVRQSGTMANDLFVKNRWMLGGILGSQTQQPPTKRQALNDGAATTTSSNSNCKSSNPALI